MNPIIILAAIFGFAAFAGLGLVFAGGGSAPSARTVKRAQAITAGSRVEKTNRAKAAANEPAQRRKALLKTLKEQERNQRKASISLEARLQQAGLTVTVQQFWIASGVFGLLVVGVILFLHQSFWIAMGLGFAAGLGLPRWVVGFLAGRRTKKFTAAFPTRSTSSCAASSPACP